MSDPVDEVLAATSKIPEYYRAAMVFLGSVAASESTVLSATNATGIHPLSQAVAFGFSAVLGVLAFMRSNKRKVQIVDQVVTELRSPEAQALIRDIEAIVKQTQQETVAPPSNVVLDHVGVAVNEATEIKEPAATVIPVVAPVLAPVLNDLAQTSGAIDEVSALIAEFKNKNK